MAIVNGHEGLVHVATVAVGNLLSWEIETTVVPVDTTSCQDTERTYRGAFRDGSFSFTAQWDSADAGQEDIDDALITDPPATVSLTIYPDGTTDSASPKYTCTTALITSAKANGGAGDGLVEFSVSGVGYMEYGTVT